MIKRLIKIFNHEIWMICKKCGLELDARLSDVCDSCGHNNTK